MTELFNYPHISGQIRDLWGTPKLTPYIQKLYLQEREKPRMGFSHESFSHLLFLAETHKMLYGY